MHPSTSKTAKRRLRNRLPGGDGSNPAGWYVLMLISGSLLVGLGLILLLSNVNKGEALPTTAQVSLTAVLESSEQGLIDTVKLPGAGRAASAVAAESITEGRLVEEFGQPLAEGDSVTFFVDTPATGEVVSQLVDDGVAVWMGSTAAAAGRGVGYRFATGPAPAAPTGSASSTQGAGEGIPVWPVALAVMIMLSGALLLTIGIVGLLERRRVAAEVESAQRAKETTITTRFSDVSGADEAVEQMRELVHFLTNPERYQEMGAKMPKGALLVGPPGTGKTLLARALAGESSVPMISASGSEFVEMYVGVGAKRVRELFSRARKHEKAIIFIDEVDAVARKRSEGNDPRGNQESENTLIALLTEMDGFKESSSVVVIAATNRPDILDPALTRPGRLDRRVEVPLPDRRGREGILSVHTRGVQLDPSADLELVARRTPGFSGAQLAAVVNEAAICAVRENLSSVNQSCFDAAVATVAMGRPRTSALVTDFDRLVTAWHEGGHTVAALLLKDADPPVAVSIVPRGPAGGVTWMSGTDEQFLTRAKAHARLVVALAGRAAEQMLLGGEFTQGASGDLQAATDNALLMATRYGMTSLGLASRGEHLGGTATKEVTLVVEDLLAEAHSEARALLEANKTLLEAVAEALLERNDLSAADLKEIAERHGVTPASAPTPVPEVPVPARSSRERAGNESSPSLVSTMSWDEREPGWLLRLLTRRRPKAKA